MRPLFALKAIRRRCECDLYNLTIYYSLSKILSSDWLNTNLILDNVWLVGTNDRQRNLMLG